MNDQELNAYITKTIKEGIKPLSETDMDWLVSRGHWKLLMNECQYEFLYYNGHIDFLESTTAFQNEYGKTFFEWMRDVQGGGGCRWLANHGFYQWLAHNGKKEWLAKKGYIKWLGDNGFRDWLSGNGFDDWVQRNYYSK
jgi:hypothetical protein